VSSTPPRRALPARAGRAMLAGMFAFVFAATA